MAMRKVALWGIVGWAALGTTLAQAGVITWSTGPNFGGPTGYQAIQTNGTLVEAINLSDTAVPLTVDPSGLNITFTPNGSLLNQFIYSSGSPGSTDSAWNSIIDKTHWNFGNVTISNFFTGLTVGRQYQVQLFASDTRFFERTQFFHDGQGNNSATFNQNSFTSIIGAFTATGTTQALGLDNSSTFPILNAFVLRDVTSANTVPEPGALTLWLVCIGGLVGSALVRRRRAAAARLSQSS